jgi:hypothetical protein
MMTSIGVTSKRFGKPAPAKPASAAARVQGKGELLRYATQGWLPKADDGVRTHDPQLGKLMLYQLSYVRVSRL